MAEVRTLSRELAEKAARELNEIPERIGEDLQAIRTWLSKCPHLKARTDDQFLLAFLRSCKFSIEKVKEKLDNYYTIRTTLPELIRERRLTHPNIEAFMKMGTTLLLPQSIGPDGPTVMIMRTGKYDASLYTLEDLIRLHVMLNDICLRESDNYVVAGMVQILDLADVTLGHFSQFNLSFVRRVTLLFQEGSPIRQKGFHYINTPPLFDKVFALGKTFMNEKLKSRVGG
jgi:hypothetical protein